MNLKWKKARGLRPRHTATGDSGTRYTAWQGLTGWWAWTDGNGVRAGLKDLAECDQQAWECEQRRLREQRLQRTLDEYANEGDDVPAFLSAMGQEDCRRALRMLEEEG